MEHQGEQGESASERKTDMKTLRKATLVEVVGRGSSCSMASHSHMEQMKTTRMMVVTTRKGVPVASSQALELPIYIDTVSDASALESLFWVFGSFEQKVVVEMTERKENIIALGLWWAPTEIGYGSCLLQFQIYLCAGSHQLSTSKTLWVGVASGKVGKREDASGAST